MYHYAVEMVLQRWPGQQLGRELELEGFGKLFPNSDGNPMAMSVILKQSEILLLLLIFLI